MARAKAERMETPVDGGAGEKHVGNTQSEPPTLCLSQNAVRLMLRRIFIPTAAGDFKVPKEVMDDFNGDNKSKLYALFEKSGYDKEWVGEIRK